MASPPGPRLPRLTHGLPRLTHGLPARTRPDDRVLAARAMAVLFVAGATAALLTVAVPHGSVRLWLWVPAASAAYPIGVALFMQGARFSPRMLQVLLVAGSVLIAIGVAAGHGAGAGVAVAAFYSWVALYSGFFFSLRAAALQVGVASVAYAVALLVARPAAAPADWLLVTVASVVSGAVTAATRRTLDELAATDALTGLANRRAGLERLAVEVARAARSGRPLSIALIDLDEFKKVNDAGGHRTGDALLQRLGQQWPVPLRRPDLLARYGGDEFLLVLPDTDADSADRVLQRLRQAAPDVAFSAGVSTWVGGSAEDLVEHADAELYLRKLSRTSPAGDGRQPSLRHLDG